MPRIDVTQADVLQAILGHYRSTLLLDDARAFLVADPMQVSIPRGGDWWLTIAAGDGVFDQAMMTGGVIEQCTEDSVFTVSGHVRLHLDDTDNDSQLLLHATQGLMPLKHTILKTIASVDLQVGGNEFARELITPRHATAPMVVAPAGEEDGGLRMGLISVTFGLMFDWDLS